MRNKKLFYGILVVVLVAGVSTFLYLNKPLSIADNIYNCNEDNDCVSVKSWCCGCNAGGSNTAINKNYLEYWYDKLSNECRDIGCAGVMSNHWTCFAEPKCVDGKCQMSYVFDKSRFCPDDGDCNDYGLESRECEEPGDCVASCSYGCVSRKWMEGMADCEGIWPNFECECLDGICQRN